jgi:hypothetical protein
MSGNGAFEGEMNDVALFENALRAAVPTQPDQALGTTLVPRLAAIARAATLQAEAQPSRRRTAAPRSRLALVARVGIVVALIPLVLAGLAWAGVTVPSPARSAFESVGITLPNQPADGSGAGQHGQSSTHRVSQGTGSEATTSETTTTTTTKGKSDAAHKHALEQHKKAQGKALGHEQGKAIGLNGSTPPGQAKPKETGPPSHSNAGGNSATHTTPHAVPQHTTHTPPGNANGHTNGHSKTRGNG